MLRFGTDGVRGVALTELTVQYATDLGLASAKALSISHVVIGRDTRKSGLALQTALAKGFALGGATVELLGIAPTPSIAFAASEQGCAGAVVTASHNPYGDNGIKIFGIGGKKLTDAQEQLIEREMTRSDLARNVDSSDLTATTQEIIDSPSAAARYRTHIESLVPANSFANMSIVVDCANGAMSDVAPYVLAQLGATVIAIHCEPNGTNINAECGATHPQVLAQAVRLHQAAIGLAFDGDGDRVIAVDHAGNVVDGDHLLALAAIDMKERNVLSGNGVVVTVMTNAGFHAAMLERNIDVVTTPVGDRNVLIALEENNFALGGEQSGHIIYRNDATTGDGLLAGVRLLDSVQRKGVALQQLAASAMTCLPQVLINVRVATIALDPATLFESEIAAAERQLGGVGRVLLRASGTEPMVRVMVEAQFEETANAVAQRLASIVTKRLGGSR
ncbi:MAG: phosphoglucosamine mutase [Actinobacteria bacterium]|nr:MAG: phosphoglucosamine mutase [Actinomycetota bacterium]